MSSSQKTEVRPQPRYRCDDPIKGTLLKEHPELKCVYEDHSQALQNARSLTEVAALGGNMEKLLITLTPKEIIQNTPNNPYMQNVFLVASEVYKKGQFNTPSQLPATTDTPKSCNTETEEPMSRESHCVDSTQEGGTIVCHHDTEAILESEIDDNNSNTNQPAVLPGTPPQGGAIYYNCTFNNYTT